VGAEFINPRKLMVRHYTGAYYEERAIVTIDKECVVTCNDPQYAPTPEEKAAMKAALTGMVFPHSVVFTLAQFNTYRKKLSERRGYTVEEFYPFVVQGTEDYVMAQERMDLSNGDKRYIPHVRTNTGQWIEAEPDGALPLYFPSTTRLRMRYMLHEGARSAWFAHTLAHGTDRVAERLRATHGLPSCWLEYLRDYEHIGFIGGAKAPHRTNWQQLVKLKPTEVIVFADNDKVGKAAIPKISKAYCNALRGIELDERWPVAWDFADFFPQGEPLWSEDRYKGPDLRDLLFVATHATEKWEDYDGDGKKPYIVTKAFKDEVVHCVKPDVVIFLNKPAQLWTQSEFNHIVRPFSDVKNVAELLQKDIVGRGHKLTYDPSVGAGKGILPDGLAYINTHTPTRIKPERGDVTPWLELLNYMFVVERERDDAKRWFATHIAALGTRMSYGMLTVSETQGVGKTTIGQDVLAPLTGWENVSVPSESDIVESNFNSWRVRKRFILINEIYAGGNKKAYNKLKSVITDKDFEASEKYLSPYRLENWAHVYASSNSLNALRMPNDDRRWFIPSITEEKKPDDYWRAFQYWLSHQGGLNKIHAWAIDYIAAHGPVLRGTEAPHTHAKTLMSEESLSPGMAHVQEVLNRCRRRNDRWFVTDWRLRESIIASVYSGHQQLCFDKPRKIRKHAQTEGFLVGTRDVFDGKGQARIITSHREFLEISERQAFIDNQNFYLGVNDLAQAVAM
jgi:hypothetical protein